jgi:hypothetical protein
MRRLVRRILLVPSMARVQGVATAGCSGRVTCQRPVLSAVVVAVVVLPVLRVTVTFSPGAAVPQMGRGFSRWRTALWVKGGAGVMAAGGGAAPPGGRIEEGV